MERRRLDSRALASAGYDPGTATLELEFVDGRVYRYFGVPQREYARLLQASSHGRYFQERIRDRYPYEKVAAPVR